MRGQVQGVQAMVKYCRARGVTLTMSHSEYQRLFDSIHDRATGKFTTKDVDGYLLPLFERDLRCSVARNIATAGNKLHRNAVTCLLKESCGVLCNLLVIHALKCCRHRHQWQTSSLAKILAAGTTNACSCSGVQQCH